MARTIIYFGAILALAAAAAVGRASLRPIAESADGADGANGALRHPPRRIASLSPSTTELCAALGLTDRLVARSRYCDWPPTILEVPPVGGLLDLDVERLVAARPDVVLLPGRSQAQRDALSRTGLRFVSLPDSALEDVFVSLEQLGRLAGVDAEAAAVIARIRHELDGLTRSSRPARPLRVLLVVERLQLPPTRVYVAGPGSYLDRLLRLAGHENAMASLGRVWGEVGLEEVLLADPDAIIEFPSDARVDDLQAVRDGWAKVGAMNAVRSNRVFVLAGQQHTVPGPRVADTLRAIVELLRR